MFYYFSRLQNGSSTSEGLQSNPRIEFEEMGSGLPIQRYPQTFDAAPRKPSRKVGKLFQSTIITKICICTSIITLVIKELLLNFKPELCLVESLIRFRYT